LLSKLAELTIKKGHPKAIVWRTKPFPWFNDCLLIYGDTFVTSRYVYHSGLESDIEDDIFNLSEGDGDAPNTPNILIDLDAIDPRLRNLLENPFLPKTPITTDSSRLTTSNSTDYIEDLSDSETQAQKRRRTSANTKATNESTSKLQKKGKVSRVGVIGGLVDGFIALASSISALIETITATRDDTFSSIIEGQAVAKIERKICLTKDSVILAADLLANARPARIYMALKSNKIRRGWLKVQIVRELGLVSSLLSDYFIEPKAEVKALHGGGDRE
jgi:hypothetical protein